MTNTRTAANPRSDVDTRRYEREQAAAWLMEELEKGRRSGEEEGYFSLEEVEKELGITYD